LMSLIYSFLHCSLFRTGLIHRYSFTEDIFDAISTTGDGTLIGGAYISAGELKLDSTGMNAQLPAGLLGTATNVVSIEIWASFAAANNIGNVYTKVFHFGNPTANVPSLQCYRDGGSTQLACSISGTTGGTGMETGVPFDGLTNAYIAVVYNIPLAYMKIWVNGALRASAGIDVTTMPGTAVNDSFLLGKGTNGDPQLIGSINEFRIWNRDLSEFRVSYHSALGPNELLSKKMH
jgi:hypothetical protein